LARQRKWQKVDAKERIKTKKKKIEIYFKQTTLFEISIEIYY